MKFDNAFIKEKDIKIYEKLPKQIAKSLEEIKSIDKDWNLEKLNYFLNCCSNIEKSIDNIKEQNESLEKYSNSKILNIDYSPKENELNQLLEKIKSFGNIYYEYEFENYSNKENEKSEYILNEGKENIITKISEEQNWIRILSKNILELGKEYNFKIKIIKSKSRQIMLGIAEKIPETLNKEIIISLKSNATCKNIMKKKFLNFYLTKKFDINIITNYGWYYNISNSSLYSDFPNNYRGESIYLENNNQMDELKFNVNMKNGTFNLILNDKTIQLYNKIPSNKEIAFSVLLFDKEDSIEIS